MPKGNTGRRVVLLGAGHSHLFTIANARRFADAGHELVVVAPGPFWYSGLATGMLGGLYEPSFDCIDVGELAARGGGRFVPSRAVGLDPATRRLRLEGGESMTYDALSFDVGSEPPAVPGAEGPECYAVKPIPRMRDLRAWLETRFAEAPETPVRIAVAGGGPTGCELAANVAGLAQRRAGRVAVTLLSAGERLLKGAPDGAARKIGRILEGRGIEIRRHARVVRVEGREAVLDDGARQPFDAFVNATGLKPNRLLRDVGLPLAEEDALLVDTHLRSPDAPEVHGGGDCIAVKGHALARIGVHAIRQSPVLCHNLLAAANGTPPQAFAPQTRFLWIVNLGDGTGLAMRGGLWWYGRSAFWLKDRIDRRFLERYRP
jgi:NADH dehydrogenase FAD-containing subunit